eukprot:NODE_2195_length_499_cov_310.173333_g1792_i0.p1 GENE.NODE_2195_length_499_cov_310.173333_g1792_i0~~NODE_2195_length_499_cov_310.173333_g1792_i0.p1  ORF type:complete len:135 (+),score=25.76 NODE_2195_length_499_cov_310.173333_g1792_i0:26-406(+)
MGFFVPHDDAEKDKIKTEVHRLVTSREARFTNFVDYRTFKLIYRRYASLYFTFVVDIADNELAILESIHLLVEILDLYFGNVCELDLVFNFHKVYFILDELFLAGEIQETCKQTVLHRIQQIQRLD